MAPPITVDIMVVLLARKAIARGVGQQARRVSRLSRIQMRYASGLEKAALIAWIAFLFVLASLSRTARSAAAFGGL
jgi:hypothetical protein